MNADSISRGDSLLPPMVWSRKVVRTGRQETARRFLVVPVGGPVGAEDEVAFGAGEGDVEEALFFFEFQVALGVGRVSRQGQSRLTSIGAAGGHPDRRVMRG